MCHGVEIGVRSVCFFLFFFFTPSLTSLSTSFKHAIRARLEVSMGMMWCGETGVVCLEVVCEFQVGFGFDFLCLTMVMSLISGGFLSMVVVGVLLSWWIFL